jgi:hypothetical protein
MRFTSGNQQSKKYIIETNGTGVAFLDYDRDGRQDVFLTNGSRLEASRKTPLRLITCITTRGAVVFAT